MLNRVKFDVNIRDPKSGYKWLEQFSSITKTSKKQLDILLNIDYVL